MTPLALTDAQLKIIMQHAAAVRSDFRSRFLEAIVDQLEPRGGEIEDDAVEQAVRQVCARMVRA